MHIACTLKPASYLRKQAQVGTARHHTVARLCALRQCIEIAVLARKCVAVSRQGTAILVEGRQFGCIKIANRLDLLDALPHLCSRDALRHRREVKERIIAATQCLIRGFDLFPRQEDCIALRIALRPISRRRTRIRDLRRSLCPHTA